MLSQVMCRRGCKLEADTTEAPRRDAASRTKRVLHRRTAGGGGCLRGPKHHPLKRSTMICLRPVNIKGNRARGMRAPQNTNQFLMHEKYQMMHMRSDSVGSDSGSCSDTDSELTDMDSYLGALENARGALLDSPEAQDQQDPQRTSHVVHEDSMQYFPSEDDLMQSQNFMQRDFAEFCDFLTF
ncbi:coiled-coil domain-containing glutamate-rich protein 1 [Dunckerocampus dactyliophorus]|uniref:coiled-coil domain-containing glutamate-rich protein 1 n=1 Tax=Dunckerocampus dactyliophorus TaxID=161453 RepID=UPI002404936D|nr:coiled-coil domain-containing glutamate-rich protein 1 [Dunckerocampus dactyliophorus]